MRHLEVGDMVVYSRGFVGLVDKKYINSVEIDEDLIPYSAIKTIRKPRPGSRESRDIVAMLARHYHRSRIIEWKADKRGCSYNYRLRHWSENTITCLNLYQEAKSMLK